MENLESLIRLAQVARAIGKHTIANMIFLYLAQAVIEKVMPGKLSLVTGDRVGDKLWETDFDTVSLETESGAVTISSRELGHRLLLLLLKWDTEVEVVAKKSLSVPEHVTVSRAEDARWHDFFELISYNFFRRALLLHKDGWKEGKANDEFLQRWDVAYISKDVK